MSGWREIEALLHSDLYRCVESRNGFARWEAPGGGVVVELDAGEHLVVRISKANAGRAVLVEPTVEDVDKVLP